MNFVNPFADGINLKRGCGIPCPHLRCDMSCCDRAKLMADGKSDIVRKKKTRILSMINRQQYWEALKLTMELFKFGYVNERRIEIFRIKYFSCPIS